MANEINPQILIAAAELGEEYNSSNFETPEDYIDLEDLFILVEKREEVFVEKTGQGNAVETRYVWKFVNHEGAVYNVELLRDNEYSGKFENYSKHVFDNITLLGVAECVAGGFLLVRYSNTEIYFRDFEFTPNT